MAPANAGEPSSQPAQVDATPWLFLLAGAVQLAPLAAAVLLPAAVLVSGLRRRPIQGIARWAAIACMLAVWAGDLVTLDRQRLLRDGERLLQGVESTYAAVVEHLRVRADEVAGSLAPLVDEPPSRAASFAHLETFLGRDADGSGDTVLLVDGSGRAWAWAGPGLRHDLPEAALAREGVESLAGFTAVTFYAVEPVAGDLRRPWRVVAGRSESNTTVPFAPAWIRRLSTPEPATWSLSDPTEDFAVPADPAQWIEIRVEDAPSLRLRTAWLSSMAGLRAPPPWWLLAALGLLAVLAALELVRAHPPWPSRRWGLSAAAVIGGALAVGLAFGVGAGALGAALVAVIAIAWAGAASRARGRWWRGLLPIATAAALGLAFQRSLGPIDLSQTLGADLEGWLLRLAGFGLVFAGALAAERAGPGVGRADWPWLGALVLGVLAAAAAADRPLLAVLPLAVSAVSLVAWGGGSVRGRLARLAALALAAAALSATLWTVIHRDALRSELKREARAMSQGEEARLAIEELDEFLREVDVERLALGDPDRLAERRDLALALWQASPLADRSGLSALRAVLDDGTRSKYTDGLDFQEIEADAPVDRPRSEVLRRSELAGAGFADLYAGQRPIGAVEYLFLPLTTRDREPKLEAGELARALLGGANADPTRGALPGGARLELFAAEPSPESEPGEWERENGWWTLGPYRIAEHNGPALWGRTELPGLAPVEALRAVALHATSLLAALLGCGLVMVALALLRPATRAPVLWWASSYSKKLMLAVAVLLVVPIGLLDLFLFQSFDRRLQREQRTNGEAALRSAETILADYLPTLEPGFSFDSAIDADLLAWLSRVVSHEVNLYWRGYAYASSRPELFAAGILPRRIPGRVFSRLALAGEDIVVEQHRVGPGVRYLELYRPISLPGEDPGENGLFLSVPLVAQQEEARRALAVLGQQTVVVTALILLLLVVVGARIAASFTTPLMAIVEGTDRIARGERSLGIEPREPELAALTEAIDDMAARVAEARERLLREKQVVDGVVANITSAVVSIGGDDRVQMCNRTATELLGVTPGEPLEAVAERAGDTPLAELLRERPRELTRRTARIHRDGDEEEWTIVWAPVAGPGDPAALLVVEDVTEVLRGQRLEAWAEMARMIAHEVKNPLTPIRLSAEHLQRVHAESPERLDEVFDRCIGNILTQVSVLRDIAAEFSVYSRIPSADLTPHDLVPVVEEVVDAYAVSPPRGISVSLSAPESAPVRFDARLIARAVRNLVQNAVQASGDRGSVEVSVQQRDGWVSVQVDDRGPGVPPELLPRIFEPNFSTTSGGTGLGLPITQRIVEEHGGRIEVANREEGGLSATITLPSADADLETVTAADVPARRDE
ncbi:MAG TPA: ATP-binding protein [Thermoanaerobaculia bacterium]|nr:ATP-binding protein [Thermoanaerobaculia bacterium]